MTSIPHSSLFDLDDLSVAIVSGVDATQFLQGQLSNDIALLEDKNPHQLSAYCNPKGRMLALFHVLKLDEGYALIAPNAILNKVLPRLKMFVMRSAVDIAIDPEVSLIGVQTPEDAPDNTLDELTKKGAYLAQHNNDSSRHFALLEHGEATLSGSLKTQNDWNILDINQCLPQVLLQNYETLIPQSVNLDIVGGVNFKKGCFPGQEIIARVKYRGKPKTRMIGVRTKSVNKIELGGPVFVDDRNSAAGMVLNIATQNDEILMNISTPVSNINGGAIYLDEARTILLERLECPYEIKV